jgi:hypothetical protein
MPSGPSGQSVQETATNERPIRNVAFAGLEVLDANAELIFTRYLRVVLPADGFVFWVRADQLSPSGLYNAAAFNTAAFNQLVNTTTPSQTAAIKGSLHHSTTNTQDEDTSFSIQRMVFTSEEPVNELNAVAPGELWIADWNNLKFCFSKRDAYYEQAGLFHYSGDAVYASMASQIVDFPRLLPQDQVVSNSLPIWLTLNTDAFGNALFPVYPSYLIPDNTMPPYAAVHIGEDDTSTLTAAPWQMADGSRWQLAKDRVRVTLYGVRNNQVMDWLDGVMAFSINNPNVMGLMQVPVPRDAKKGQTEMNVIAQKKIVEFDVSYYQQRIQALTAKYIEAAFITLIPQAINPVVA